MEETQLVEGEPYQGLIQECQAIIIESEFINRIETIKGKWLLGQAVCQHVEYVGGEKGGRGIESFTTRLAKDLSAAGRRVSPRELRRCSQFYQKFPTLELDPGQDEVEVSRALSLLQIPGDKTISWKLISRELLPEPQGVKRQSKSQVILEYSMRAIGREWTEADHTYLEGKINGRSKAAPAAD